jgi:hypothetical protein
MGDCPYEGCAGYVWLPIAENAPGYERHVCEECGGVIWTRHSRVDPWSMTEADFLAAYQVDEETHQVRLLNPPEPLPPELVEAYQRFFVDLLLYGNVYARRPAGILHGSSPVEQVVREAPPTPAREGDAARAALRYAREYRARADVRLPALLLPQPLPA